MRLDEIAEIVAGSHARQYAVRYTGTYRSTFMRLFVNANNALGQFNAGSRLRGVRLEQDWADKVAEVTPIVETREQRINRDASACLAIMKDIAKGGNSGRRLDKYLESGEYTDALVAVLVERAKKNDALMSFFAKHYPVIWQEAQDGVLV